jgi:hypothetical protein
MPKFVLKVLDGQDSGRQFPFSLDEPLRIGRKPGNQVQLSHDEKVSGQHAELVQDGGMLLLRDLGSTNGTRVDGKRIEEIPVAHGDRFQIGQTMLQLIDEELGAPVDEGMSLEIDRDMLARSGKRSPVTLLLLLVLILGGGGAWYFLQGDGGGGGPAAAGARKVVAIEGNLLDAADAHFEEGEPNWIPLRSGASFAPGSTAHTGRRGLEAWLGVQEGESLTDNQRFAASAGPAVQVSAGSVYEAQAMLSGGEGVRVALRLAFYGPEPKPVEGEGEGEGGPREDAPSEERLMQRPLLVAGSPLRAASAEFELANVAAIAPPGTVSARVVLVAALAQGSDAETYAYADDVGLSKPSTSLTVGPIEFTGSTWQTTGTSGQGGESSAWLRIGGQLAIRSLSALPSEEDAPLLALSKALPLPVCDLFDRLSASATESGLSIEAQPKSSGARLVVEVPSSILNGLAFDVRREAPEEMKDWGRIYEGHAGDARFDDASALLLGEGLVNFHLAWDEAGPLRAMPAGPDEMLFEIPVRKELRLQLDFRSEVREAQRLYRAAQEADRAGERGKALRSYQELIVRLPFDRGTVAQARQRRNELLLEGKQRYQTIQESLEEAKAFGYEGLFRELLAKLDTTLEEYEGARAGDFYKQLEALRSQVEKDLTAQRAQSVEGVAERYLRIHEALIESDKKRLAGLVERYLRQEFPGSEAVKKLKKN